VLCKVDVQSLGGPCAGCGAGERTFTSDPTAIGSFVVDFRDHADTGETFCVYSVAAMPDFRGDPDAKERRTNCAVHANQTVCLPCPTGGGCPVTGWHVTANLNINNDRADCKVLLESKGGACATCPDKGVLFKTP